MHIELNGPDFLPCMFKTLILKNFGKVAVLLIVVSMRSKRAYLVVCHALI